MEINWNTIALTLIPLALGFIGAWLFKPAKVVREVREFFDVLDDALMDETITDRELADIVRAGQDIIEAFRS